MQILISSPPAPPLPASFSCPSPPAPKEIWPSGVYLLDFFCSGIQFNLLLSPYPCFISLLYLDLYVLGDDALIS